MGKTGQGRGREKNSWRPLCTMPILCILLSVIAAKCILWNKIPAGAIPTIPLIIGGIVGCIGSYRGACLAPRHCFLWGIFNAVAFMLMLMIGNILFFGVPFHTVGETFLWIMSGGCIGAIFANLRKGKIA